MGSCDDTFIFERCLDHCSQCKHDSGCVCECKHSYILYTAVTLPKNQQISVGLQKEVDGYGFMYKYRALPVINPLCVCCKDLTFSIHASRP